MLSLEEEETKTNIHFLELHIFKGKEWEHYVPLSKGIKNVYKKNNKESNEHSVGDQAVARGKIIWEVNINNSQIYRLWQVDYLEVPVLWRFPRFPHVSLTFPPQGNYQNLCVPLLNEDVYRKELGSLRTLLFRWRCWDSKSLWFTGNTFFIGGRFFLNATGQFISGWHLLNSRCSRFQITSAIDIWQKRAVFSQRCQNCVSESGTESLGTHSWGAGWESGLVCFTYLLIPLLDGNLLLHTEPPVTEYRNNSQQGNWKLLFFQAAAMNIG